MSLSHDTILAPDRTYVWWAVWPGARPAVDVIVSNLRSLELLTGEPDTVMVPVVSRTTDTTANGVVWPLRPVPVSAIMFHLARLGATNFGVEEWPDSWAGRFGRAYWDRFVKAGIEGGKTLDAIGDATGAVLRTALLAAGLGLGVYLAITRGK